MVGNTSTWLTYWLWMLAAVLSHGESHLPLQLGSQPLSVCPHAWDHTLTSPSPGSCYRALSTVSESGSATTVLTLLEEHEVNPQVVTDYLQDELQRGRIVAYPPSAVSTSPAIQLSPFGVIPKRGQPNKWLICPRPKVAV